MISLPCIPFVANLEGADGANYLELSAWRDGSFEAFNSPTQIAKHYSTH
jgi:hypothetical protein